MQAVQKSEHDTDPVSWEAAVSAWVDGEDSIRAEELDTPYGRQLWDTYHLIGDVLRSDELAIRPSDRFYARLSAAIDAEPTVLAPRRRTQRRGLTGLVALALVPFVASAVWFVAPWQSAPDSAPALATVHVAASDADDDAALSEYYDAHQGLVGVVPVRQVSYSEVRP